LKAHSQPYVQV